MQPSKPMTHKDRLVARLNELREKFNMPKYDPKKVTMTTMEIEGYIGNLEKQTAPKKEDIPPTTGELFKQLNVLRSRAGMKHLKRWSGNYKQLEAEITKMELRLREQVKVTRGKTKIADGANSTKEKTDMHKNPVADAMRIMRKKEKSATKKERKATAKRIATWAGFKTTTVFDYLEAKDMIRPPLAGDALKDDIRNWIKTREKVMPKKKGRAPNPLKAFAAQVATTHKHNPKAVLKWLEANKRGHDKPLTKGEVKLLAAFIKDRPKVGGHGPRKSKGINPQGLATALKTEARLIRVKLRRLESKIPKAWRIEGERWGFKPEHQKDLVKLLGGE